MKKSVIAACLSLVFALVFTNVVYSGETPEQPEPAPEKEAKAEKKKQAIEFTAGDFKLKLTGFGQVSYLFDYTHDSDDTFDVQRTRFCITGKLKKEFGFHTLFDFQLADPLLHFWVDIDRLKYAKVRVGQFGVPFGRQTPLNPYNLLTINYGQCVANLNGGKYFKDQGIMVHSDLSSSKTPILKMLNYKLAFVNGEGRNTADKNDGKAVVCRLGFKPKIGKNGKFELGFSFINNETGNNHDRRHRLGLDFRMERGPFLLQGEYIEGVTGDERDAGFFLEFGCKVTPRFQLVGKYDVWRPETGEDTNVYAVGFNCYFSEYGKLQVIGEVKDEQDNEVSNNDIIVQLGFAF